MKYRKNFYQIRTNDEIFDNLIEELDTVGHYNLPLGILDDIKQLNASCKKSNIVLIGVGGSSLGVSAIYDFLKKKNTSLKRLFILDSTDPIYLQAKMDEIDLEDSFFVVASKSGTTIESIGIFKYISSLVSIDKNNCAIISCANTPLAKYANKNELNFFQMDENISGRFSVFSVVGIVPLCMVGIDIDLLLKGAKGAKDSFFAKDDLCDEIMQKARFMVENKHRFNINIVFSYSYLLEGFNKWYMQLWAESLGKLNINQTRQSLTPISLLGPIDQHSFLQSIMQGVRDKSITFILIDDIDSDIAIPKSILKEYDDLSYIDGISFSTLIKEQAKSTIKAIEEIGDVPVDVITIEKVDEYNIAYLMYTYHLLVSTIGCFLQINTYNQPGIERGKEILKNNLQIKKL
jgi:glucose-6-phosphate isomerase